MGEKSLKRKNLAFYLNYCLLKNKKLTTIKYILINLTHNY